jgi:hypothetical protein
VHGQSATYLLLGPVELDSISDARTEADLIIDEAVGRPASRMGDVTGDGLDDLVFVRREAGNDFTLTVIAGGNGGGIDLPREVTWAWITEQVDADPANGRVRTRRSSGAGYADATASLAVLNWNDDGYADAIIRPPHGPGM